MLASRYLMLCIDTAIFVEDLFPLVQRTTRRDLSHNCDCLNGQCYNLMRNCYHSPCRAGTTPETYTRYPVSGSHSVNTFQGVSTSSLYSNLATGTFPSKQRDRNSAMRPGGVVSVRPVIAVTVCNFQDDRWRLTSRLGWKVHSLKVHANRMSEPRTLHPQPAQMASFTWCRGWSAAFGAQTCKVIIAWSVHLVRNCCDSGARRRKERMRSGVFQFSSII